MASTLSALTWPGIEPTTCQPQASTRPLLFSLFLSLNCSPAVQFTIPIGRATDPIQTDQLIVRPLRPGLTMDVLRKKTLLQMAEKSLMLSWRRFYGGERDSDEEVGGVRAVAAVSEGSAPWWAPPPWSCRSRSATPQTAPPARPRSSRSTSCAPSAGLPRRTSWWMEGKPKMISNRVLRYQSIWVTTPDFINALKNAVLFWLLLSWCGVVWTKLEFSLDCSTRIFSLQ